MSHLLIPIGSTSLLQPLIHGVPEVASSEISGNFLKLTTSVTASTVNDVYSFSESENSSSS